MFKSKRLTELTKGSKYSKDRNLGDLVFRGPENEDQEGGEMRAWHLGK
jgi:hypothetical protein